MGLLEGAIEEADRTLAALRPHIEDAGVMAILFNEPSCLSAIKDDWLTLKLQTPLATRQKLAGKSFLAEDFLDRHGVVPQARAGSCIGPAIKVNGGFKRHVRAVARPTATD